MTSYVIRSEGGTLTRAFTLERVIVVVRACPSHPDSEFHSLSLRFVAICVTLMGSWHGLRLKRHRCSQDRVWNQTG